MPAQSKSQQRLFGWVHAYQKGEAKNAPKKIKDIAKSISKSDARDFAKTKTSDLPEKKASLMDELFTLGFAMKCAECGIDAEDFAKLAENNIGMTPEQYRAFLREEEADLDDEMNQKATQLGNAGLTGGTFRGGVLQPSATKVQPSAATPPNVQSPYAGFNSWYGENRDAFQKIFSDASGNFSRPDYESFKRAYPTFFTGSNDYRTRMFSNMQRDAAQFGTPLTTAKRK